MAQRVSQDANLTLGPGSPNAYVSQDANLALAPGSPVQRVSQVAVLTLIPVVQTPPAGTITPIIFVST